MDSLLPFIEYCISEETPEKITANSLKDIVEAKFPFGYPLATYECIVDRFVTNGILAPVNHDGMAYYVPVKGYHKYDIGPKKNEIQRAIDLVAQEYCAFARTFNRECSLASAKSLILDFFIKHLEPLLSPDPSLDLSSLDQMSDEESIVCLFIIEQFENTTESNQHLNTLIKGIICYTYIYYRNDSKPKKDLSNVKVFLDTPLIIYALGYSGKLRKQLADELINQLKSLNAEVLCYEHSLREIWDSLIACEQIIKCNGAGYGAIRFTVEYFLSQPDSLSKIYLAGTNLEQDIEQKARIKIFKNSLYEEVNKEPFIDEEELASKLADEMDIAENDIERAEADAKSINLTNYLRGNKKITELSDAKAIFVTKNRLVVKVSSNYLGERQFEVPTTFHYSTLSALLLLSNEIQKPDLPLTIIIENCYAAVAPSNTLWKAYIQKLNEKRENGEINDIDYLKYRSLKLSRKPLLKHTIDNLPISSISIEEIRKIDEERILSESVKAREEERLKANSAISKVEGEKERVVTERDKLVNGIQRMKIEKKESIKKKIDIMKWVFVGLIAASGILAIFTPLPLALTLTTLIISIICAFATFFPNKFINIEEKFIKHAEEKIERYIDI